MFENINNESNIITISPEEYYMEYVNVMPGVDCMLVNAENNFNNRTVFLRYPTNTGVINISFSNNTDKYYPRPTVDPENTEKQSIRIHLHSTDARFTMLFGNRNGNFMNLNLKYDFEQDVLTVEVNQPQISYFLKTAYQSLDTTIPLSASEKRKNSIILQMIIAQNQRILDETNSHLVDTEGSKLKKIFGWDLFSNTDMHRSISHEIMSRFLNDRQDEVNALFSGSKPEVDDIHKLEGIKENIEILTQAAFRTNLLYGRDLSPEEIFDEMLKSWIYYDRDWEGYTFLHFDKWIPIRDDELKIGLYNDDPWLIRTVKRTIYSASEIRLRKNLNNGRLIALNRQSKDSRYRSVVRKMPIIESYLNCLHNLLEECQQLMRQ